MFSGNVNLSKGSNNSNKNHQTSRGVPGWWRNIPFSPVFICSGRHMWKRRKDLLPYLTQKTKTSCQDAIRKDTWPLSTRESPQHTGHIAGQNPVQLLKRRRVSKSIFRVEYLHLLNHHPPQSSRAPQQPPPSNRTSTPPIFPFSLPASSILLYPTLFLSC